MSTVALSRPGTIATLIAAGSAVSNDASASTVAFKIHVQEFSDQYEVKVSEVTGDGHTQPSITSTAGSCMASSGCPDT